MTDINKILSNQQTQQTIVIEEKSDTTGNTASTTNATVTPVTSNVYADYCGNRLPCGYCRMLMRDCPKYYTTTWTGGDPNIKVTL